jgi:hypothetical protein
MNEDLKRLVEDAQSAPQGRKEYTFMISSVSPDKTTFQVRLCTGATLTVPASLLKDLSYVGRVSNGDTDVSLGQASVDLSDPAGYLISQLASEVERLSHAVLLDRSRRDMRGRSTVCPKSGSDIQATESMISNPNPVPTEGLAAQPANASIGGVVVPAHGTPGKKISTNVVCNGAACYTSYSIFHALRRIASWSFTSATGCTFQGAVVNGADLTFAHTNSTPQNCGEGYTGKIYFDVTIFT